MKKEKKSDDVNIRIGRKTYKRLKIKAAKCGKTLKETVEILSSYGVAL